MRRAGRIGAALAIAAMLNGCAMIRTGVDRDLRYPGGVGGAIFDRYGPYAVAPSKELQLFRAAVTLAVVSRIATANVTDGKEADALIEYEKAATREIDYAAIDLYEEGGEPCPAPRNLAVEPKPSPTPSPSPSPSPSPTPKHDCRTALFESDLPNIERSLINVAFAGLPKQDAVKVWKSARSGDALGAIWRAVQLTAHSLDGAHRAAAVHRSGVELFALMAKHPEGSADQAGDPATITAALCFIGYKNPGGVSCAAAGEASVADFSRTGGRQLDRDAYAKLAKMRVPQGAFDSVFEMVEVSCRLLPISANDASAADPADARRKSCATLTFSPVSRLKDPPPGNKPNAGATAT